MARVSKGAWAKSTLKTKEVHVEELGGEVLVRELSADYTAEVSNNVEVVNVGREQILRIDKAKMELLQFAHGVINDDKSPMFTEAEVADLQKKHGRAFQTVIGVIDEISGIDKEAIEKAEATFPSSSGDTQGEGVAVGDSPGD